MCCAALQLQAIRDYKRSTTPVGAAPKPLQEQDGVEEEDEEMTEEEEEVRCSSSRLLALALLVAG